jgi:hypothetical protein
LIHQENERNLAALRDEREKAAKDKADQAEQARIAQERQAAAQKTATERSSNNLIAGLFGIGAALAGSSVGMNTSQALSFGLATAADVAADDATMAGSKAAANRALQEKGVTPNQATSNGTSTGASKSGTTQSRKYPLRPPIKIKGGPTSEDLTCAIPGLAGTYKYPDGSSFTLESNGSGTIHYYYNAQGGRNTENVPIQWGIQLTTDGNILERSGYWLLFVVDETGSVENQALEYKDGDASGWRK